MYLLAFNVDNDLDQRAGWGSGDLRHLGDDGDGHGVGDDGGDYLLDGEETDGSSNDHVLLELWWLWVNIILFHIKNAAFA